MSSKKITYLQDMPPEGGYGPFSYAKKINKKLPGWFHITSFCGFTGVIWYIYFKTKTNAQEKRIELKDCHQALMPLLLAEDDRILMRIKRRNRDLENEIMKNVPGWKTGTLYGTPLYYNRNTRILPLENYIELNLHTSELKRNPVEPFVNAAENVFHKVTGKKLD